MSVVSYSTIAWSFIKERRIFKIKTKSIGNAFEVLNYMAICTKVVPSVYSYTLLLIMKSPLDREELDSWGWQIRMVFTLILTAIDNNKYAAIMILLRWMITRNKGREKILVKIPTFQPHWISSLGFGESDLLANSLPQQYETARRKKRRRRTSLHIPIESWQN